MLHMNHYTHTDISKIEQPEMNLFYVTAATAVTGTVTVAMQRAFSE